MASGIFAILDDIAALMDDVALTAKLATKKTAGILGDDLAVNAEKATGFVASREIPVLWAVTKGSLLNKVMIVPVALLLSAFLPIAIKYILILGGFYLAYEGVEKIIEFLFHRHEPAKKAAITIDKSEADLENAKVKSAVMTDFILSVEIVIIALGTVLEEQLFIRILTVSIVSFIATVGVYGIVALIVRMDDAGYSLIKRSSDKGIFSKIGRLLVKALPVIIRILNVVGTIALILVAGGIFVHNIEYVHHLYPKVPSTFKEFAYGLIGGSLAFGIITGGKKVMAVF